MQLLKPDGHSTLSSWCDDLRKPGHWHPAAIDVVVALLPTLSGWPGHRALQLMDMNSPEAAVMRTQGAVDDAKPLRVWRAGEIFYSAKALSDGTGRQTTHSGGDGFLGALAQELELGDVWKAIHTQSAYVPGSTKAEQLRNMLADRLWCADPCPVETASLPALSDASTSEPPAKRVRTISSTAQHAPNALSQRGLDTLVNWLDTSNWASEAGDIAPQFVTHLPKWPAGRALEVHEPGGRAHTFGLTLPGQAPVRIWRENEHYAALVNGRREDVPGDGNCFFHATVRAMGDRDAQAFVDIGFDVDAETQATLMRNELAQFVQENPREISRWVDLGKIALRTDASARRPLPPDETSAKLPDLVLPFEPHVPGKERSSTDVLNRTTVALNKLLSLAETNRSQAGAGSFNTNLLDRDTIRQCAIEHQLRPAALARRIGHDGNLSLNGHADFQKLHYRLMKIRHAPVGHALLASLQLRARNPVNPLKITDQVIVEHALEHRVPIRHLRELIKENGDLTSAGQPGLRTETPTPRRRITAEMLLEIQAEILQDHTDLRSIAKRRHISPASLRSLIKNDATLTLDGRRKLTRTTYERITCSILLEIRQQLLHDKNTNLPLLCEIKNLSYSHAYKYFDANGDFTVYGENFLHIKNLEMEGKIQKFMTAEALLEVQEIAKLSALSDKDFLAFAIKKDMPFLTFKYCMKNDGQFTSYGKSFLRRSGIEVKPDQR